ncbi:MAG: metallophosphoesterase [Firmicutes bacterium]|jgi:Icc-related predicted phosphoesterase|nr:metallophosphoesterase [Bacillota bacterium]
MSQPTSSTTKESALTRRGFLALSGAAFGMAASGGVYHLAAYAQSLKTSGPIAPFRFVQLTDTHLGYVGDANRSVMATMNMALGQIALLTPQPDFLLITGDLTQGTVSDYERKRRLLLFKQVLDASKIPYYTVPGEHDALMDRGVLYQMVLGDLHYGFLHKGVQFLGLDNVSRGFFLGREQLKWVKGQLDTMDPATPLILFCHAPLYNVFAPWNWYTFDGAALRALVARFRQVTVFYGHVHQVINHRTENIAHWAGLPAAWPLPEPGELVKLRRWPQGGTHPYLGLGYRVVDVSASGNLQVTNLLLSEVKHGTALG